MPRMSRAPNRRRTALRRLAVEMLEARQLMTAAPLGALPNDTGEFMLGRVAVTPVLLESNGQIDPSSEDWTTEEINQVLANVATGMDWWVETLQGITDVHSLEFVIDDSYATTPVETPYEPISRRSNDYSQYVGQFLLDIGYNAQTMSLEDAIRDFNHSQREKLNTDWSFTIFVVDSSSDSDGQFAPSGSFRQAFAFAGGLFFVTPSTRPASTYTHETGHMFWARDEYPNSGSYNDRRGYYNTQNTNAIDDAPPGFVQQPSIMSSGTVLQQAYDTHTSAASTLAQIGWQDSDGDGIFDVLDVPLSLDVAAVYDASTRMLNVRGTASAVPLLNRNSSGLQSDITLNQVNRIEYRVDGGAWIALMTSDAQSVSVDLEVELSEVPLGSTPGLIEIRAIDAATGIESNIVSVTSNIATPGVDTGISGFAFVDSNDDGLWGDGEVLLSGVSLSIVDSGSLFRGRLEPDDSVGEIYSDLLPDLLIESVGNQVDGRVAAFAGTAGTGAASFNYGSLFGGWGDSWTHIKQELSIVLDLPTTSVSIVAAGKQADSYGRLEGYDAEGNLIAKSTSEALAVGETEKLSLFDAAGRIKSIRAFGVSGTSVSLDDFRYGPEVTTSSESFGTFELAGLPDGIYDLAIDPPSAQYDIIDSQVTLEIVNGVAQPLVVRATAAASPWMNPQNPFDVNNRDGVQPLDALVIINELNRNGARALGESDSTPPYLDVNGDFQVTPIDALRVINYLNSSGNSSINGEGSDQVGGVTGRGVAGGGMDSGNPSSAGGPAGSGSFASSGFNGTGESGGEGEADTEYLASAAEIDRFFAASGFGSFEAIHPACRPEDKPVTDGFEIKIELLSSQDFMELSAQV